MKICRYMQKNTSTTLGMSDDLYCYRYLPFVSRMLFNPVYFLNVLDHLSFI